MGLAARQVSGAPGLGSVVPTWLAVALALTACESAGVAPAAPSGSRDVDDTSDVAVRPVGDTSATDVAADVAADSADDDGADDGIAIDAVVTDAFVRPDAAPRDVAETVETDAAGDAEATPTDTASGDVEGPDRVLAGTHDCLRYEIRVSDTRFNLKLDDIRVTYFVQNVCATPYTVRVEHFGDFFAIGIHRNGEPWIFLPDCPGTGAAHDYTFTPRGGGVNRGWIWSATDHEARMERCGVTFDPSAAYSIVGYGATEIDLLDTTSWSEIFVMTDPIEIELRL